MGVRILLVKLSSLGDVVHALPVVQDILAALPGAHIDWVVEKSFAPVLALHPGVRRVIPCEIRRWRKSPLSAVTRQQWNAFKADLRQTGYDAVIDLQGLTKSALVARLARLAPGGKRFALANQTDGSGYEAPTRWVADVAIHIQPHIHAVQRSRELVARALGYCLTPRPDYGLKRPLAQTGLDHLATEKVANRVAFVHGTSRADKEWPLGHWTALGQRLNAAGYQIALPHGNEKEKLKSQAIARSLNDGAPGQAVVWPLLALDALTHELAQCAGVIGVDSGVSHIAVALDLPHVQLYNFDTAWRTGPDAASARQVSVYAAPQPSVDAVWQAWLGCLATVQGVPGQASESLESSMRGADGA
ncbi:lipopolysaccharide heptosyltransferase I [Polaromonas sp. CG_23.6]|uniref:lipopolysaccharide heptosyltransferase I n=1 Tax=unclassified Polaromonas TaxID=2638319 RepID=UPI0018CAF85D|nr:lipopolysaccharide heptosyltransferase I [Polaromonas sp. CG_23.6]MBG6073513.1 heptosyltransferase-1 [Polaromonas sp. CG_9.7]MBG6115515.1 heptosyltransferase-1 [Polaromonas sp. CG_9.2]MDH6185828.1 heptosyltransferase-1 [Polaromonas sp. CG_23.6]